MKCVIILSFDFDEEETLSEVIKQIDPVSLKGFNGQMRVAFDPIATEVETWLDE